jgi:hypothetical protein
MVVFWWTRRGYLALLTTIGVVGAFGALATVWFGDDIFERLRWLWGLAYECAAVSTWIVGSYLNGRPMLWSNGERGIGRFIYDAPNRFVSLPVETWAVPLSGLGWVLAVVGLLPQAPDRHVIAI